MQQLESTEAYCCHTIYKKNRPVTRYFLLRLFFKQYIFNVKTWSFLLYKRGTLKNVLLVKFFNIYSVAAICFLWKALISKKTNPKKLSHTLIKSRFFSSNASLYEFEHFLFEFKRIYSCSNITLLAEMCLHRKWCICNLKESWKGER